LSPSSLAAEKEMKMRGTFFKGALVGGIGAALVIASSAAIAGTGIGGVFNLGKVNRVNQVSALVGKDRDGMLKVTNKSTKASAVQARGNSPTVGGLRARNLAGGPAAQFEVTSGSVPPFEVNSNAAVSGLNADLVDGRSASAFLASSTYMLGSGLEREGTLLGDNTRVLSQSCLPGDRVLSGGPASIRSSSIVLDNFATDTATWQVRINPNGQTDTYTVVIICADQ
jgi:hypothetical protein